MAVSPGPLRRDSGRWGGRWLTEEEEGVRWQGGRRHHGASNIENRLETRKRMSGGSERKSTVDHCIVSATSSSLFPPPFDSVFDRCRNSPKGLFGTTRLYERLCLVLAILVVLAPAFSDAQSQTSTTGCVCQSYCNILDAYSRTQPICQTAANCGTQITVSGVTFWGDTCATIDAPTRTDTGAALSTASVSLAANYTVPADPGNTTNIDFGDGLTSGAVAGAGSGLSSDFGLVRTLIVVGATALLCAFVATVVGWWYIRQRRPLALYHSVLPMSKNADRESTGSTDDGPSRTKRIWDKLGLGSGPAEESVGSRSPSATFIPVDSKSPPPELPSGSRQMLPPPSMSSNLHPLSINRDGSVVDDVSDSSSSVRNGKPSSPRGVAPSPTPSARRARLADLIAPVPRGAFTPGPGSHSESNLSSLASSGASSESEGETGSRLGGPHAPVSDRVTSTVGPPGLSQARKSALGKPYTVILPHKPHAPDEIALRRADAVFIFEVYTDSWAYGLNASTGREGIFPMSAVAQVGGVGTAGPAPGSSGTVFQ